MKMVISKISVKNMETRAIIRKHYKVLRNKMSAEEIQQKSAQICGHIIASSWYKKSKVVLGYYPLGNEVNILPILEHALSVGKVVALPRTDKDYCMDFYQVKNLDTDVTEGAFHIMEPKSRCELLLPSVSAVENDTVIVLVPGVVFDKKGNRYGYGRGFYDRYFVRYEKLHRVGIAYGLQISEESLETYPTDVKMHRLVNEKEEICEGTE